MISAVVLAAGKSIRMGEPKINLPWGRTTVLGQILTTLIAVAIGEVIVVSGETEIVGLPGNLPEFIHFVQNPIPDQTGMLGSLKIGLAASSSASLAALVVLGDQPQIEPQVIKSLLQAYRQASYPLLMPSYHNRRGHPWLLGRSLWPDIARLDATKTMRDFLREHNDIISYLVVESASILQDLDTPADYARYHANS